MHDEVAHMGVIYGALRGTFPGSMGGGVIWKYAHDINFIEIFEFNPFQISQLATKYEMEELFRCLGLIVRHVFVPILAWFRVWLGRGVAIVYSKLVGAQHAMIDAFTSL